MHRVMFETFSVCHIPFGDEDHTYAEIVAMNHVPIAYRELGYDYVKESSWQYYVTRTLLQVA